MPICNRCGEDKILILRETKLCHTCSGMGLTIREDLIVVRTVELVLDALVERKFIGFATATQMMFFLLTKAREEVLK